MFCFLLTGLHWNWQYSRGNHSVRVHELGFSGKFIICRLYSGACTPRCCSPRSYSKVHYARVSLLKVLLYILKLPARLLCVYTDSRWSSSSSCCPSWCPGTASTPHHINITSTSPCLWPIHIWDFSHTSPQNPTHLCCTPAPAHLWCICVVPSLRHTRRTGMETSPNGRITLKKSKKPSSCYCLDGSITSLQHVDECISHSQIWFVMQTEDCGEMCCVSCFKCFRAERNARLQCSSFVQKFWLCKYDGKL